MQCCEYLLATVHLCDTGLFFTLAPFFSVPNKQKVAYFFEPWRIKNQTIPRIQVLGIYATPILNITESIKDFLLKFEDAEQNRKYMNLLVM